MRCQISPGKDQKFPKWMKFRSQGYQASARHKTVAKCFHFLFLTFGSSRSPLPLCLRRRRFELRRGHECLSVGNVVCCAGTGHCDGPIPLPGASYQMCVYVRVCMCVIDSIQVQQSPSLHLQ